MAKKIVKNSEIVLSTLSTTVKNKPVNVSLVTHQVEDDWNNKIEESEAVVVQFIKDTALGAVDAAIDQEFDGPSSYEQLLARGVAVAKEELTSEMKTLALECLGLEFDTEKSKLVGSYHWNEFIKKEVEDNVRAQVKAYIKKNPILLSASELEAMRLEVKVQFVDELKKWVKEVMIIGGDAVKHASENNPLRHFSDIRGQIMYDVFCEVRASFQKSISGPLKRKLKKDIMAKMFDNSVREMNKEQPDV